MGRKTGEKKTDILRRLALAEDENEAIGVQELATMVGRAISTTSEHLSWHAKYGHVIEDPLIRGRYMTTDSGRVWAGLEPRGIPMYGSIAAGFALRWEADTPIDYVQVSGFNSREHVAFRVKGDSMLHQYICDGDIAIIKLVSSLDGIKDGATVAVCIPEDTDIVSNDWINQLWAKRQSFMDYAIEPDLNYITLKRLLKRRDNNLLQTAGDIAHDIILEGKDWSLAPTVMRIIGVLAFSQRHWEY